MSQEYMRTLECTHLGLMAITRPPAHMHGQSKKDLVSAFVHGAYFRKESLHDRLAPQKYIVRRAHFREGAYFPVYTVMHALQSLVHLQCMQKRQILEMELLIQQCFPSRQGHDTVEIFAIQCKLNGLAIVMHTMQSYRMYGLLSAQFFYDKAQLCSLTILVCRLTIHKQ